MSKICGSFIRAIHGGTHDSERKECENFVAEHYVAIAVLSLLRMWPAQAE